MSWWLRSADTSKVVPPMSPTITSCSLVSASAAIGASVGHGGVIAFDEHTSIASLMRHVFAFGMTGLGKRVQRGIWGHVATRKAS